MWLTFWRNCLIPKYWIHGYNIADKYRDTLEDKMIKRCMPIPHEWNDE